MYGLSGGSNALTENYGAKRMSLKPFQSIIKMTSDCRQIIRLCEKHDYTSHNLANMNETMVQYDSVATVTNNVRGEKTVSVRGTGYQKKGRTVALTITPSGHKLPALVIFKEPTRQSIRE